jgi:FkbM family methyltransferase
MRAYKLEDLLAGVRKSRLAPLLRRGREAADRGFIALGRPPLRASVRGVRLSGYLRHRAFLASLAHYENASLTCFEQVLRPGAIVVDGGAHVGLFTLVAALRLTDSGHVYAFEPDPYNFRALAHNVRVAKARNVTLVNAALSDTTGIAEFHASSGTIAGSLVAKSYVHDRHRVRVNTTTIDSWLPDPQSRSVVIKLDVEGTEPRALAGGARVLRDAEHVALLFEQNPQALEDAGLERDATFSIVASLGLEVYRVDENDASLEPISAAATGTKGNFFASGTGAATDACQGRLRVDPVAPVEN